MFFKDNGTRAHVLFQHCFCLELFQNHTVCEHGALPWEHRRALGRGGASLGEPLVPLHAGSNPAVQRGVQRRPRRRPHGAGVLVPRTADPAGNLPTGGNRRRGALLSCLFYYF